MSTKLKTTSAKTSLAMVGVALILIAVGLPYIPGIKGSTVIYIPSGQPGVGIAYFSYDPANPTLLPAAQIGISVIVNNIAQNTITSSTLKLSSGSVSSWTQISLITLVYGGVVNSSAVWYSTPNPIVENAGIEYQIICTFISSVQGTFTSTQYMKAVSMQGYFTINGQNATPSSVITVYNPTLTFQFIITDPTLQRYPIAFDPTIKIYNGSVLLTTLAHTDWTTNPLTYNFSSYTLPGYGTYTVVGLVEYGGQSLTLMSVTGAFGGDSPSSASHLVEIQLGIGIAGIFFIVCGIAIPTKHK